MVLITKCFFLRFLTPLFSFFLGFLGRLFFGEKCHLPTENLACDIKQEKKKKLEEEECEQTGLKSRWKSHQMRLVPCTKIRTHGKEKEGSGGTRR